MRATRLLVPVAVLALLAGCSGGGDDPAGPEPAPEREQVEERRAKGDDGADTADAADAADGGADGGATGDLAACIVGEWSSDPADMVASTDALLAAMGMTGTTVVTGEVRTTIDATTISTTYVDQVTESTIDAGGQQIVSRARMNGTLTQPYTLDGDVITSVSGDMSGVEIESTVTVDGQELPGYSEGFQQGLDSGASAGQPGRNRITCSGDTMTMTTLDMATLGMAEITVTLTRR